MEKQLSVDKAFSPAVVHVEPAVPAAGYVQSPGSNYGGGQDFSGNAGSGGLVEYWRILRRHQGTILVIAFLGLVGGILFSLPQTPVYRARTALEIQDINSDFLNNKRINPVSEGGNSTNLLADVQTQMKILQSENLVDRVIDDFKTAKKIQPLEADSGKLSSWRKSLNLAEPKPADLDYKLRQKAIKSLTVRQLGQTRIVEVLYNSTDPKFAADFANGLANQFIDSNVEARWKMSQHTGQWLTRQLDEMRNNLERSEDGLQAYARRSGLLFTTTSTSDQTNVVEEKLHQLQEELSKAQADRVSMQSRFEMTRSASPDTLADVINDSSLRGLHEKLTDLRRQQAEMITVFTAKHEKVKRIEAQIAPLEAAFARERSAILDRINNDFQTAQRREKLLLTDYANQSHLVTQQAEKSIQYNILKREVDSNRQLYESMLQQVKQASIASAMRASNVRIVDPAKVPHRPFSPDYPLNTGLGLLCGLLFGIGLVIVRERADQTIQQPGDSPFWLNMPELGVIPSATPDARRAMDYAKRKLSQVTSSGIDPNGNGRDSKLAAKANPENDSLELITWNRKPSLIAESFRALLTSILFSGENGSRPRVLVMSSGSPTEGKTTVVSNLAIALSEIRRKVLVIDADLRKPRMHLLFDIPNERGLSTLLESRQLTKDALDGLIHETAIPDLFVLPSGPSTHAAANLLYSSHLPELLKTLRGQFDMILIDTPPMLQMTDARVIGRMADAVVLVIRAGQTTREAAIAATQRFAEDKIRVLGSILNDWNPRMSPNGYYGYYNGHYSGYNGYKGYYTKK